MTPVITSKDAVELMKELDHVSDWDDDAIEKHSPSFFEAFCKLRTLAKMEQKEVVR